MLQKAMTITDREASSEGERGSGGVAHRAATAANRSPPAPHDHAVQFYDSEEFLFQAVAEFAREGLRWGTPLLVISAHARRSELRDHLKAAGVDVESSSEAGRVVLLDSREMLSTFMRDGVPDRERFQSQIGELLDRSAEGRKPGTVRVFGDMVDVLWREGNSEAALRLEELWNELAATRPFSLLCAYAMRNFEEEADAAAFLALCDQHDRVLPTESFLDLESPEGRAREVSLLQQRARALEAEIERRKLLERELRESLDRRNRAEAERERLLQAEQGARAEAEEAARLKDEFLAILSHELRTPLSAILGWVAVVNELPREEVPVGRALDAIHRNALQQLHLIEDLLDVSRIITGKMRLDPGPVDLAEVVELALASVRPAAEAKSIRLAVGLDEGVPPVNGEADRLQQVIWNLLSNAIKFTPKGGKVELRLERIEAEVQISVRDTGQGILPEFLPHVFDRFRQADGGSTRRHSGLGLGLAVVRHLVEAHGGTVAVESPGEGRGATFRVRLPAAA